MTTEHDPRTRIVLSWLREDAHENPERMLLRALDDVDTTPQRRSSWPARRFSDMNTFAKVLAATAAVVAVAVVGINLLPGSETGVGGPPPPASPSAPPPSPSPSPTPKPTATPVADAPIPADGTMQPGSYVTRPLPAPDDGLTLRFTVPAGWHGFGDHTIYTDGADGTPLQFIGVTALNSDLCHWADPKGEVNVGTTVDDLVSALVAQTKYEVSDPVDVSIGGYSGKRVDVVFPANLFKQQGSSEAPGCDEGVTRLFGDGGIYGQAPDERWQTNILDVDGTRFVIIVQDYPDTSAAARAGTAAIVDSMVIEP
jgi:hypothetical protein